MTRMPQPDSRASRRGRRAATYFAITFGDILSTCGRETFNLEQFVQNGNSQASQWFHVFFLIYIPGWRENDEPHTIIQQQK